MVTRPPPPVKLSKTPIKVNPLAFTVCGTCTIVAMQQANLNIFLDGANLELIKEWVTPFETTTLWLILCLY